MASWRYLVDEVVGDKLARAVVVCVELANVVPRHERALLRTDIDRQRGPRGSDGRDAGAEDERTHHHVDRLVCLFARGPSGET